MILFLVTIKEDASGQVRFHVQTPAGKASLAEMDVAREFQDAITKLGSCGRSKTIVARGWSQANDPARQ